MAYILGQYNHNKIDKKNWIQVIQDDYEIKEILNRDNSSNNDIPFIDIGFYLKNNISFILGQTYYCHCKIKKQEESQKITLKLINYTDDNNSNFEEDEVKYEQYIKTINIQKGENQWVDIEFIFTPEGNNFNTILFHLTRTNLDYISDNPRKTIIAFLEVSTVSNIQDIFPVNEGRLLLKMGLQSRPGLKTVINREEIYIGRTGVYEIKDGEIKINFISLIAPSINKTNEQLKDINNSISFLNEVPQLRAFDSFTLDYIYED